MHFDVLIAGAGISGIDAAYHLQTRCPEKTYAIFEARGTIGGTWDLFRYPGIRSDSDMYTLGFPFRPWQGEKSIADGASILAYIKDTAAAFGIDRKIVFHRRIERIRWSSRDARWTVEARDSRTSELHVVTCTFLHACSGYFDYEAGFTPQFEGLERFRGQVVHPQHWPAELDHSGKRIVVIGSGATAMTLVPELAKRAAHVTMLQRSPSYVVSVPARDPVAHWLHRKLPPNTAGELVRWKNVLIAMGTYAYSRKFPASTSKWIIGQVKKHTRGAVDISHFTPTYKPWDQRLCLIPDADLFRSLRDGSVTVVTDHIDGFTETGVRLTSGTELEADIVVTATGLVLKIFGGIAIEVDGRQIRLSDTMIYKGVMCSDVPNFAFSVGYTNASWTLKCDLTSQFVCRVVRHMDEHGYTRVVPRRDPAVAETPLLDFTSGYVLRALDTLPHQGATIPWKLYQNYIRDLWLLGRARLGGAELERSDDRSDIAASASARRAKRA